MAKSRRVSKKPKQLGPEEERKLRLSETRKRWARVAYDYRIALEIRKYLERKNKSIDCRGERPDGIVIELAEVLSGRTDKFIRKELERCINLGIDRGLFRLDSDHPKKPFCWGLWIPEETGTQPPSNSGISIVAV